METPKVEISATGVRRALEIDGRPLVAVSYRGRPAIPAHQIGEILGYADGGKTLVKVIRKDWAEEFKPGVHLDVLRGVDLVDFRRDASKVDSSAVSPETRALTVLYPAGVELIARKTGKPIGDRLVAFVGGEGGIAPAPSPAGHANPTPMPTPPWWWSDVHRYLNRCVAAGVLTEREALAKLAPYYEQVLGLR